MGSKVDSKHANPFLCLLFYLEALILIPVDPILILYCLHNRKNSLKYAAMATFWSTVGGISGYFLGLFLWNLMGEQILNTQVLSYVLPKETFYFLKSQYHQYASWAILICGFTPIPYKAATLSAGFCKLPFFSFVLCSCISRGARFFLIALIIKIWGEKIKLFIDRYFNLLTIVFFVIIAFAFFIAKRNFGS